MFHQIRSAFGLRDATYASVLGYVQDRTSMRCGCLYLVCTTRSLVCISPSCVYIENRSSMRCIQLWFAYGFVCTTKFIGVHFRLRVDNGADRIGAA
jgi:hypothetical protein